MYDRLRGVLVEKHPTRAVVDVSGVGYELTIPLSSFEGLPAVGETVTVHAHLHVREDSLRLYGFATPDERRFFRTLLEVSGIGPAVALSILSSSGYADFRSAVVEGNLSRLTRLKGVGRKLAQRMVLELSDRLTKEAPEAEAASPALAAGGIREDAISALVSLGFKNAQAAAEVDRILGRPDGPREPGEIIREALRSAM
jgi:Holliday junction DNA helicase RuvA